MSSAAKVQPHRRLGLALTLGVLVLAGQAHAASCEPTLFPQSLDPLGFARVTTPRLQVFLEPQACSRPTGLCPSKAYLVAGDQVVTAQATAGKTCVAFLGPRRTTIGWVDSKALAALPPAPPAGDWTGRWRRPSGDAEAMIERKGRRLNADLFASAPGSNADNVRTGGARGELIVQDDRARIGEPDDPACKVVLRRLGPFLVVNDGATDDANSDCGGIGVTMNGIYRRGGR
jgi:hypothetical protein